MNFFSSWDDGSRYDLKMANLLRKYNLTGTFFIPTNRELKVEDIVYLAQDFKIGAHTRSHPDDMKKLSFPAQVFEIASNKGFLEGLTGQKIEDFCYPSGRYSNKTIDAVKMCGFKTARTTLVGNIKKPNPFKIETTVHVYPNRKEYNRVNWLEYAKKKFDEAKHIDGYFHIWGHSEEVNRYGLWDELEELFKYVYDKV